MLKLVKKLDTKFLFILTSFRALIIMACLIFLLTTKERLSTATWIIMIFIICSSIIGIYLHTKTSNQIYQNLVKPWLTATRYKYIVSFLQFIYGNNVVYYLFNIYTIIALFFYYTLRMSVILGNFGSIDLNFFLAMLFYFTVMSLRYISAISAFIYRMVSGFEDELFGVTPDFGDDEREVIITPPPAPKGNIPPPNSSKSSDSDMSAKPEIIAKPKEQPNINNMPPKRHGQRLTQYEILRRISTNGRIVMLCSVLGTCAVVGTAMLQYRGQEVTALQAKLQAKATDDQTKAIANHTKALNNASFIKERKLLWEQLKANKISDADYTKAIDEVVEKYKKS